MKNWDKLFFKMDVWWFLTSFYLESGWTTQLKKMRKSNWESSTNRDHIWNHHLLLMAEILHHLACIKPRKEWDKMDKLPTSTGEHRISEPSTVVM